MKNRYEISVGKEKSVVLGKTWGPQISMGNEKSVGHEKSLRQEKSVGP